MASGIGMNCYFSRPVVAVARAEGHYEGTGRALGLIEGQIEVGVRGKRRLVVKPNFVSTSKQLAATHVGSVRAVLDVVTRHYHGGITVAEGPALGSLENGVSNFGYDRLVEEYDVEFADLNRDEYEELEGFDRKLEPLRFRVSRTILESDYLISVARAKTHDCVIATLSIKNTVVGALVTKREKEKIHQGTKAINLNIARLAEKCIPNLGVIDGYIGMEGRGPVNGDPVELGVAAASLHPVSLDAVMAEIMGFKALEIGYLHHLNAWRAGIANIGGIEILGEPIEDVGVKFRPHPTYEDQLKWK